MGLAASSGIRLDTNAGRLRDSGHLLRRRARHRLRRRSADHDQPRLLPVGAVAARLDHRPGIHLGQPRRASRSSGMAANGAQYGVYDRRTSTGSAPCPAMVFLGIVMMPFYYGSKVRQRARVPAAALQPPDPLLQRDDVRARQRPDRRRQPLRAGAGAAGAARLAVFSRIVVAAVVVLIYITLGGLSGGHLQRGAAVLRDPRRPDPADGRRPGQGRRLARADQDRGGEASSTKYEAGFTLLAGHRRSATRRTRSARTGSRSSSASASCSRSATGRRTSPRSSARSSAKSLSAARARR